MKAALNSFFQDRDVCFALIPETRSGRFLYRLRAAVFLWAVFSASAWGQSALPEFFGIYAVVDGKLAPMIGGRGTFAPSETSLQVYNFQKMSTETEKAFVFEGGDIHFLVFDAAVADTIGGLELYKLPYARNLITRPDALAQVGGLLNQIAGRGGQPQSAPASPLEKYVVAKTDVLKVELLQKPVSGQSQMVQLVPASKLEAGVYSLFAVRTQGGQQYIVDQLFEVKGPSISARYCVDLAMTGGFGGAIDDSDARLLRPYYLAKEKYILCGAPDTSTPPSGKPPEGSASGPSGAAATCFGGNDYNGCAYAGQNALASSDWQAAIRNFEAAANLNPKSADPWVGLGRAYLRTGQNEELSKAWDKAISLGGTITIAVCLEQTPRCERGDLQLSGNSISFVAKGKPGFAASPREINPDRTPNDADGAHNAYSFQVGGKRYTFDFFPSGVNCAFNKATVQCPPDGIAQQLILAKYVSQTLPKLIGGTLN